MLKDKRILFYVPGLDVINGAVYYSQVFGLAQYLVGQGAKCMIIESAYDQESYFECEVDGVRIVSCPVDKHVVPLPLLSRRWLKTTRAAESVMASFAPTHIYTRNIHAGLAAVRLARHLGAKVVFSRRGDEFAENSAGGRLRDYVRAAIEWFCVRRLMRKVTHVNGVVTALVKDVLKYCKNFSVLPCCVMEDKFEEISSEVRARCRAELSIPVDAKVVVYSGSLGLYQIPEVFLSLMKKMHETDGQIVFLILTEMTEMLEQKAKLVGLPKTCYRVRKCKPTEMRVYLQCADAGMILRKNDAINRNASPVKIPEYMASGLGLIASPWIGDAGDWLSKEPFVFMYTADSRVEDVVAYVNALTPDQRRAAQSCARKYYTYDGNREVFEKMFL